MKVRRDLGLKFVGEGVRMRRSWGIGGGGGYGIGRWYMKDNPFCYDDATTVTNSSTP